MRIHAHDRHALAATVILALLTCFTAAFVALAFGPFLFLLILSDGWSLSFHAAAFLFVAALVFRPTWLTSVSRRVALLGANAAAFSVLAAFMNSRVPVEPTAWIALYLSVIAATYGYCLWALTRRGSLRSGTVSAGLGILLGAASMGIIVRLASAITVL